MANEKNLYYLEELTNYRISDDFCDVRDWVVKDANNRSIGKVDSLIVNKKTEKVVYLDVEVKQELVEKGHETYAVPANEGVHEFFDKNGYNHLIVPIGMVNLDEEDKTVSTSEINYATFAKINRFNKGTEITRTYELSIMRHYLPHKMVDELSTISDHFYDGKEFKLRLENRKK